MQWQVIAGIAFAALLMLVPAFLIWGLNVLNLVLKERTYVFDKGAGRMVLKTTEL